MSEALIIGAGPAGLTAAYELMKCGVRSTVLEADQQVGGLSRTVNYRGYRFDIGGHRFFSKVPLINELWQDILGKTSWCDHGYRAFTIVDVFSTTRSRP